MDLPVAALELGAALAADESGVGVLLMVGSLSAVRVSGR